MTRRRKTALLARVRQRGQARREAVLEAARRQQEVEQQAARERILRLSTMNLPVLASELVDWPLPMRGQSARSRHAQP